MCRCWVALRFKSQKTNRRLGLLGILALVLLAVPVSDYASQLPHQGNTDQPGKAISPLQQAEELIQQGLFEPARTIIEEQLARNPADVDAYNLLGIVDTDEKDYDHALEAFQHALQAGFQLYKNSQQPWQSVCRSAEARPRTNKSSRKS